MTSPQMVDLSTPEGIYTATGRVPRFKVGDRVLYSNTGLSCEITELGVEVGHIVYTNSLNRWGYEYQYTPIPEEEPAA